MKRISVLCNEPRLIFVCCELHSCKVALGPLCFMAATCMAIDLWGEKAFIIVKC
jgi:hypothetical protein